MKETFRPWRASLSTKASSASGSSEFQKKVRQENLNVSLFINSNWAGGSDINAILESPEFLNMGFRTGIALGEHMQRRSLL